MKQSTHCRPASPTAWLREGLNMTTAQQLRALDIKRTLGIRRAAGYLRNQGVPVRYAVGLLARFSS